MKVQEVKLKGRLIDRFFVRAAYNIHKADDGVLSSHKKKAAFHQQGERMQPSRLFCQPCQPMAWETAFCQPS